jgi:hypothetical protein
MGRVRVNVSDPWDFVTSAGSNVFAADVHKGEDDGPLLLRLVEPVRWNGIDWHWFVATQAAAAASLYGVTEAQASGDDWLDVPRTWRGGSPVARAEVTDKCR